METKNRKSYRELSHISSFMERYNYLRLRGRVGESTFGRSRRLNQIFYTSDPWLKVRDKVLVRDNGNDMGMRGYPAGDRAIVHHINPITEEDILSDSPCLYDLDNLVLVSYTTHNAIHYGNPEMLAISMETERRPNDTCPWK